MCAQRVHWAVKSAASPAMTSRATLIVVNLALVVRFKDNVKVLLHLDLAFVL